MKDHDRVEVVQVKACELLRCHVGTAGSAHIIAAGGIECVVSAMEQHRSSVVMQERALCALNGLFENCSEGNLTTQWSALSLLAASNASCPL